MNTLSKTDPSEPLREPGLWESLRDHFLGNRRLFDCVQVEVSSHCPGRCSYCPHTLLRSQWRPKHMEHDTFRRLWPLMRRSSRVHLQGWGEPLLHPSFFQMADLARRAGCSVSTTTCGLLMDEELALKLVKSGLDTVAFSLAGTDAPSNASRVGVDFERVRAAISVLQRVRRAHVGVHLEVHLAYLMLASQAEAVNRLPELMHSLGIHAAVVSTLDCLPSPELEPEGFTPHETDKLGRAAAILARAEADARRLGMEFHWRLPSLRTAGATCRENIARSLFVAADGSMSPCVYVNLPLDVSRPDRRVFGNVNERDPLIIWESDDFREFRHRLAVGDPDTPCIACPKRFES